MPKTTRDIPLEPQTKQMPESTLDYAAMHAAIDRFQVERQQSELREWLVYQAPPGMYEMYLEERKRLIAVDAEQKKMHNRFVGTIFLVIAIYVMFDIFTMFRRG